MPQSKSPVTIQDVARAAGVSVSTVSRVLNDKDDVAATTYERVQNIIAEMGYTSSLAAKSLRSRKTNVVGLIMPSLEDSYTIEVMRGVNHGIIESHYDLLVYTSGDFRINNSAQKERHYASLLNNSLTDGVIIVAPVSNQFTTNGPLVAIDTNIETPGCPVVIATNRDGAITAMDYLLELGHRRIGFVGGRTDLQSGIRRLQGYLDSLEAAGIPADPALIQEGNFTWEAGYYCGQRLLTLDQRPTAIFAANDQSAFGVIRAAHELGLQIPRDVSIVGFDNVPEAAYHLPTGLTTVDQSVREMGLVATEMLIDMIDGKPLEQQVRKLPTHLIVRGSCRPI